MLRDRDSNGDGTLDERLYVAQDANHNVTALFDNSGTVVERYAYDPFGQATVLDAGWNVLTSSAFGWLYLHQGGRFDATSGLYHFRHRDYSPTLGRWTSLDPLRYDAGDVNLYRYVGNTPITFIDPLGLVKIEIRYNKISPLGYYHAYIVVTDEHGNEWYYRAGPTRKGRGGSLGSSDSSSASRGSSSDSITPDSSQSASSNSSNSTSPGTSPGQPGKDVPGPWGAIKAERGKYTKGTIDWNDDPDVPRVVVRDDNSPAKPWLDKFDKLTRQVNQASIPYNPLGPNSNSFAHDIIEKIDLERPTPPVWAPGHRDKLDLPR